MRETKNEMVGSQNGGDSSWWRRSWWLVTAARSSSRVGEVKSFDGQSLAAWTGAGSGCFRSTAGLETM